MRAGSKPIKNSETTSRFDIFSVTVNLDNSEVLCMQKAWQQKKWSVVSDRWKVKGR